MRKIAFTAAFAACCIANPALAEDEGDWTGAYIGVNVGYHDAKSDQSVTVGGSWASESQTLRDFVTTSYPADSKAQDVNFGGQIGYNYQTAGGLVMGLEADVSALSGKESSVRGPMAYPAAPALTYTVASTFDPKVSYGLKAKLGFASGNTLFYATGGWSWTNTDIGVDITSSGNYHKAATISHTFDGYQIGGGVEQRLGSNLSVRLDYAYTDQGDVTFDTVYMPGSAFAPPALNYTETFTQDYRAHMIRLGVNFHF